MSRLIARVRPYRTGLSLLAALVFILIAFNARMAVHAQAPPIAITYNTMVNAEFVTGFTEQAYTFEGQSGEQVVIAMASDEFDTRIYIAGPDGVDIDNDDDGGYDYNSLIYELELPRNGAYTIRATSFGGSRTGRYGLGLYRYDELPMLEDGQEVSGTADQLVGVYRLARPANGWLTATIRAENEEPNLIALETDSFGDYESVWVDDGVARLGPIGRQDSREFVLVAAAVGDFTLAVDWVLPVAVPVNGTGTGRFAAGSDALYFSFRADWEQVVDVQVDSDNLLDTRMTILDPYGREVSRIDDGDGMDPWLTQFAAPTSGDFLVILEPQQTGASLEGPVTLRVESAELVSLNDGPVFVTLRPDRTARFLVFEGVAGQVLRLEVVRRDESDVRLPEIEISQDGDELVEVDAIDGLRGIRLEFEIEEGGEVRVMLRAYDEIQVEVSLTPVG